MKRRILNPGDTVQHAPAWRVATVIDTIGGNTGPGPVMIQYVTGARDVRIVPRPELVPHARYNPGSTIV